MPTLTYACPRPFAPPLPDKCIESDVLDIVAATNAGSIGLADADFRYIQLICRLVEQIDLQRSALAESLSTTAAQLEVATGAGAKFRRELEASRDAHQACLLDLEAITGERERALTAKQAIDQHRNAVLQDLGDLRKRCVDLSEENRQLRTVAAFDTVTLDLTGLTVAGLNEKLNAEGERDRIAVAAICKVVRHRNHAPTIPMASMFDVSDETHVVDMDCLDEPAACRTITPRSRTKTMGEENGWDR